MDTITRTDEEVRGGDIAIFERQEKKIEVEILEEGHGGDFVDFLRLAAYVWRPDGERVLGVKKQSGLHGYFHQVLDTITCRFDECTADEHRMLMVALDAASHFGYVLQDGRIHSGHILSSWELDY